MYTARQIADAWFKRANGFVKSLRIDRFMHHEKHFALEKFRNAAKDFWSKLEELEVSGETVSVLFPEETIQQLHLRSIRVTGISYFSEQQQQPWDKLRLLDKSNIRMLSLEFRIGHIRLNDMAFSKLTTLELTGTYHSEPFFELLRRNPALETLLLTHSGYSTDHDFKMAHEPVHLPHLNRVELIGNGPFHTILRSVKIPNLTVTRLQAAFNYDKCTFAPCIDEILSQNITGITRFYLTLCDVPTDTLLSLFWRSFSLTTLMLKECRLDINQVINALCRPVPGPGLDAPGSVPCPRLQVLGVSGCTGLRTRTIKRLIKSRLEIPAMDPENELTSTQARSQLLPLPILHLNIGDCHRINHRAIEWLRSVVPSVTSNS